MAKHFQSKDNQSSSSNTRKAAAAHVQAKMKVGQKNDAYEKEADHAAEKVTAQPGSRSDKGDVPVVGRISKLSSDFGKSAQKQEIPKEAAKEEKKPVQKMEKEDKKEAVQKQEDEESQSKVQKMDEKEPAQKMAAKEEEKPVQKMAKEDKKEAVQKQEDEESQAKVQKMEEKEAQAKTEPRANVRDKQKYPVLNSVEPKLLASKGKGEPLPDEIRIWLESRFGADFGKVRIHTGGYAVDMAREMEAQAFTNGSDIYFNDGKFDPDSLSGKILLAHELTHVIQQNKAEQKLSAEKIAESNAGRNAPLPSPPDKDAKKTKEEIEKAKKEAADAEMKKTEKQKKGPKKPKVKSTAKVKLDDKKEEKEGDKKMGVVALFMKKMSKARVAKKMRKLAVLAARQKKKDDAKTKLEQSQKSVLPPAEESQSKANASQVDTVNQSKEPKPDEQKAKQAFNEAMDKAVPSSLEAMDKFKEEGKGQVVGEQVRGTVTADTQEVQGTYQEIENTPEPAPAETPDEMPPIEATPETPAINMGEDVIGEVQPEHTDMSEFSDKADKTMEDEEISDDQLEMVDSGPLAEAKEDKKQLKNKVETGPKEVKELENQKKKEVSQEMKKEEMKGKKQMKAKRKKELNNTKGKQKNTKKTIEQKRQAVTDHINGIYKTTNDKVKKKLEDLEKQSLKAFDDGQAAATKLFEDTVKRRLDSFKSDRYSGMFGWARWLKDKLLGMEDLPAVKAIFDSEKANFIATIDRLIAKITADNKKVIQECKDMVQKAREDIAKYVSKLGPELRDVGKKAQADMQKKLDALDETVNKKAEELKKKLDEKRAAAIKAIEEKIDSMKSEMSGLAGKLAALLLGALIKFFTWAIEKIGGSSDKIMGVVNKSKKVIKTIVKSPGKFIGNLGKAVKQGFALFQTNFTKHLMGGIVEWLTGAMGGTGITMPEKFDLKGVMSVGLQVLGLTWEQIREKIAKRVGEPVLAAAEKGLDIIVQIKEKGFIVLWDMLVEKAQELKDKVMESISGWAVIQIVKSAITKLLTMLNPAGAILQIALTIYDGVMWFIENMQRIMDFIMSIFNSIAEIAFGQLGKAAGFIEAALAKIIPIILSFLARWLKLSGVGKAIKKAVKKVRDPIDKVLVKIINFVVGKIKKLFGKKGKKKGKDDKASQNKKHKQYGKEATKTLSKKPSKKLSYEEIRKKKEEEAKKLEKKYNGKLKKPVKMKISFKNTPQKDKEDNDIDFHIHIGPNDFDIDAAIDAQAGGEAPVVDKHKKVQQKTSGKERESHHVPPKGLLKWIHLEAKDAITDAQSRGNLEEIKSSHPWLSKLASMTESKFDPGDNLAAIGVSKFTHIKKTGDASKDVWRIHWGKETAKEIFRRLKDKDLVLIYKNKYAELSDEEKQNFQTLAREADESLPPPSPNEEIESPLSTQFYRSELSKALKTEQQKWTDKIDQFKNGVGNVAKGAAAQAYTSVVVALEKSEKDGTKEERKNAINALKPKSKETWNKIDGVSELKIF